LKPYKGYSVPHIAHAMVTLPGAGEPRRHILEMTIGEPDPFARHLLARATEKQEGCWRLKHLQIKKSHTEENIRYSHHVLTATISASLIDAPRFSSYWKLIRSTALVLLFLQNMHRREKSAGS